MFPHHQSLRLEKCRIIFHNSSSDLSASSLGSHSPFGSTSSVPVAGSVIADEGPRLIERDFLSGRALAHQLPESSGLEFVGILFSHGDLSLQFPLQWPSDDEADTLQVIERMACPETRSGVRLGGYPAELRKP